MEKLEKTFIIIAIVLGFFVLGILVFANIPAGPTVLPTEDRVYEEKIPLYYNLDEPDQVLIKEGGNYIPVETNG